MRSMFLSLMIMSLVSTLAIQNVAACIQRPGTFKASFCSELPQGPIAGLKATRACFGRMVTKGPSTMQDYISIRRSDDVTDIYLVTEDRPVTSVRFELAVRYYGQVQKSGIVKVKLERTLFNLEIVRTRNNTAGESLTGVLKGNLSVDVKNFAPVPQRKGC